MKKVLSLLLAVVLVCSMATVAFAGASEKVCKYCDFTTTSGADYDAHMLAKDCGRCGYCGNGFATSTELKAHIPACIEAKLPCDYCGGTFDSENDYAAHIDACKAKYFNIPVDKLVDSVVEFFKSVNYSEIFETVKNFFSNVIPVITGLFK